MATIKSYTSLEQSHKLAGILPLETADMCWQQIYDENHMMSDYRVELIPYRLYSGIGIPCWSLAALLNILPEINNISLKMEKVKAKDGYDGYYYPIEYEGIVLIPYSKNPIDACYDMIIKLYELKLL